MSDYPAKDARLIELYFMAAHPLAPESVMMEAKRGLIAEFNLDFVGPAVGGIGSVPYDSIRDSMASLRRLPKMMGDEDALRTIYGLVPVAEAPKTKRMKRLLAKED